MMCLMLWNSWDKCHTGLEQWCPLGNTLDPSQPPPNSNVFTLHHLCFSFAHVIITMTTRGAQLYCWCKRHVEAHVLYVYFFNTRNKRVVYLSDTWTLGILWSGRWRNIHRTVDAVTDMELALSVSVRALYVLFLLNALRFC